MNMKKIISFFLSLLVALCVQLLQKWYGKLALRIIPEQNWLWAF